DSSVGRAEDCRVAAILRSLAVDSSVGRAEDCRVAAILRSL
ncbi:hypothetical protein V3C99_016699, partial [Haemonchus contortus]